MNTLVSLSYAVMDPNGKEWSHALTLSIRENETSGADNSIRGTIELQGVSQTLEKLRSVSWDPAWLCPQIDIFVLSKLVLTWAQNYWQTRRPGNAWSEAWLP